MKLKPTIFVFAMIISNIAGAGQPLDLPFDKLPKSDEGVKLVPASELTNSEGINEINEQLSTGYVKKKNSDSAKSMLTQSLSASQHLESFAENNDPKSTHLRSKLEDLSLGFTFPIIKPQDAKKVIGFAPGGTYINQSWSGAVELFNSDFGATCSLRANAIKLSHASIVIPEETASTKVNGKITAIYAEGSLNDGYYYNVSWYDDVLFRDLECASTKYDPKAIDKMVEIAKRAD